MLIEIIEQNKKWAFLDSENPKFQDFSRELLST